MEEEEVGRGTHEIELKLMGGLGHIITVPELSFFGSLSLTLLNTMNDDDDDCTGLDCRRRKRVADAINVIIIKRKKNFHVTTFAECPFFLFNFFCC